MNTDDYRWQARPISTGRAPLALICTLLIVLLLGLWFAGSGGAGTDLLPQRAARLAPAVELTPSLHEATKPRVLPKRADDWLERREITGP
jgi:hypothetical protein